MAFNCSLSLVPGLEGYCIMEICQKRKPSLVYPLACYQYSRYSGNLVYIYLLKTGKKGKAESKKENCKETNKEIE